MLRKAGSLATSVRAMVDGHAKNRSRSSKVARRDPVGGVAAKPTWVTRPSRSLASFLLLRQIEEDLFDNQATETVADEGDRPALEARLFKDINGPVLERHRGPEPIGWRSLVSHGVDRNSVDVLGQPERPKRNILWCFSAPGPAPSIIGVAAEAMHENDARSRRAAPPGDLDQSRHANSNSAKRNN